MLAARAQAIKHLKQQHPFIEEGHLLSKLMAYCSKEAHSCVEKAAMISFVKLRILEPDSKCSLRGDILTKVVDIKKLNFKLISLNTWIVGDGGRWTAGSHTFLCLDYARDNGKLRLWWYELIFYWENYLKKTSFSFGRDWSRFAKISKCLAACRCGKN